MSQRSEYRNKGFDGGRTSFPDGVLKNRNHFEAIDPPVRGHIETFQRDHDIFETLNYDRCQDVLYMLQVLIKHGILMDHVTNLTMTYWTEYSSANLMMDDESLDNDVYPDSSQMTATQTYNFIERATVGNIRLHTTPWFQDRVPFINLSFMLDLTQSSPETQQELIAIMGSTAWKIFYDMGVNDPVADRKDSPWWPVRHYYFLHLSTLLGYIHVEMDNIFQYIINWNATLFTTDQLKDFRSLALQIKAASKKCGGISTSRKGLL